MAASRKLQGEIDRCLKKVTEGVETFEDIWQKVHNAANANQKEKYEADLKKEIKKLQRLRDQIKSWITSGEIKDKTILYDNRKLIETQMERFKVVERETKTKAYSKEGLGAAQKLDPAQKEKDEITSWLGRSISTLNIQVDQYESELESLVAGVKKKRVDKDKQDRADDLKLMIEKHRFHITKLETILRMLDNMSVEVEQVKKIKDDVEYYIESSQDDDFQENEYLYDDINGIDDVELSGLAVAAPTNTDSNGTPISLIPSPIHVTPPIQQSSVIPSTNSTTNEISVTSGVIHGLNEEKKKEKQPSQNIATSVIKPTPMRASSVGSVTSSGGSNSSCVTNNGTGLKSSNTSIIHIQPSSVAATTFTTTNTATALSNNVSSPTTSKNGINHHNIAQHGLHGAVVTSSITATTNSLTPLSGVATGNFATVAATNIHDSSSSISSYSNKIVAGNGPLSNNSTTIISNKLVKSAGPTITSLTSHHPSENGSTVYTSTITATSVSSSTHQSNANNNVNTSNTSDQHLSFQQQNICKRPTSPAISVENPISITEHIEQSTGTSLKQYLEVASSNVISIVEHSDGASLSNNRETTSEIHLPPILGVTPLGPVMLSPEQQQNFKIMESAFQHIPHPADSLRLRPYLPRHPCNTPTYYPQTPLLNAESLEYHSKLATDTLFFIFYYSEGTKSQYLAAKALKKQSWRFHTKYMMWFQRHEEPRTINEEFELGTYIYFDYEKWMQRKKDGFTFEYKYLEDRDLN